MRISKLARGNQIVEFVMVVAIALALAFLVQAFVVKPYKIPTGSMEPTLIPGQRVLVDRRHRRISSAGRRKRRWRRNLWRHHELERAVPATDGEGIEHHLHQARGRGRG